MRDLRQSHPLAFDYVDDGTMKIFRDAASFDRGIKIAHWLKQVGIEHRQLDTDGVVRIEPNLAPVADEIVGGIGYPGDETGNARMFCEEMRRVCSEAGVRFRFAENVVEIIRKAKAHRGHANGEGDAESRCVRAGRQRLPVRCGASNSASTFRFALQESARFRCRCIAWEPRPRVPVVDDSLHAALVPVGGVLRVAGTAEFTGYDLSVNPKPHTNLVNLFGRVYPKLAERVGDLDVQPWCGLRPLTPDGMPIVGKPPLENLYLNTGHGPLGWSMACGTGRAVADIVTGAPTGIDMSTFALKRF
jgi:D-amino-acid dehydrogenase